MEEMEKTYDKERLSLERRKVLNDTLSTLENLLTATRPVPPLDGLSETKWEPALSDKSLSIIENKVMELIKKI